MDPQKQSDCINKNTLSLPPAQLWVGQHEHVIQEIELYLQKTFCQNGGCQTCTTCMHIRNKQHHAIMWFYPDKTYTIDHLDGLFSTIAYSLQPNEKFFFILQKTDFLTNACANKLLKPMEEPPAGYHFILLAEHAENILPTITSRCTIQTFNSKSNHYAHHLIYQCFTTQFCSPTEFAKIIDYSTINERESSELFNEILTYWLAAFRKSNSEKDNEHIETILTQLKKSHKQLPMPGSSILFWRNLYLSLKNIMLT